MARTIGLTFPEGGAPASGKEPTKAELAKRAEELGIEVPKAATKAQIAALVEQAEAE